MTMIFRQAGLLVGVVLLATLPVRAADAPPADAYCGQVLDGISKIVTIVSGTPERRAEDMGADLHINACWPFGDAVLQLPAYDIKVLPPSGVVASTAYFMWVAETAAALSS